MNEFWVVLSAVLPVFCLAGVGVLLRGLNWLTEEADQSLMRITLNVLVPCLILDSISKNQALRQPENVVLALLLGFGTMAVGILAAWWVRRWVGLEAEAAQRTFAYCTGVFNYIYVPLPLAILLFADRPETVGVLFVFGLGVEVGMWTLGILMLSGAGVGSSWRRLLNAPVLAIALGLFLNFTGAQALLPQFLVTTARMFGQCAFPMGLLLIGAVVADQLGRFQARSGWRVMGAACLLRLGLLPVGFLLLAKYLPCGIELRSVLVLQAAMPAAVFPIVIAKHYGGDPATALQVVIGTSLVGLVTIPLWLRLGMQYAGL